MSRFVHYTTCLIFIVILPHSGLGQSVESLVDQGKTLRVEGKRRKAADVFATVLQRASENVESLVQMGATYEDLRKWRKAIECYKRALKIAPGNPIAARNLKQLESFRAVNAPVKIANPAGEHLIQIGLKAYKRGDLKRALEVFRLCRGLLKDDPRPLLYSSVILEREGKTRSAIALYERTVETFPRFAPAHVNYVIALLASGDRQKALRRAQESLEVLPGNVRLRYLARLISQSGFRHASNKRVGNTLTENRVP